MKLEVDKSLLPIKTHFFFFFAALGPILPQINVFGRQLGVSADVMGMVTAVLPLLWAAAKPMVGYVVDYWPNHRKLVFMLLIIIMSGSYCCLWFLHVPDEPEKIVESIYNLNDTIYIKPRSTIDNLTLDKYNCHWNCSTDYKFNLYLSNSTHVTTMYIDGAVTNTSCSLLHMQMETGGSEIACLPIQDCNLLCYEATLDARENNDGGVDESYSSFYTTVTFWGFVLMMSVGTVAFNVANCTKVMVPESIMQGPTYALCYSTIVGYAAHVAPEGYSATVQGIVAGMDDGVGFALGSLVGGQLYSRAGGRGSFRILAGIALFAAAVHALLFAWLTRNDSEQKRPEVTSQEEGEKMLALNNSIYRDTVVPVV
ncbi:uncharacterized protein LOC125058873 [Pieris napi]|uniref:uncharacterized protein LOC125058873 n=1 Tax=Pieris napi TaxID=78633 RepID=UPI001FBBFD68|nr:uncharacterized protein LOC125058873 [Pieris napi]